MHSVDKLSSNSTLKSMTLKLLACSAMTSFKMFDNCDFHEFCDAMIAIGAKYGKVSAKDVLYGRHAISNAVFDLEVQTKQAIIRQLEANNNIQEKTYCISTDVWTSNYSSN